MQVFAIPQHDPAPPGYAVIEDTDAAWVAYLAAQSAKAAIAAAQTAYNNLIAAGLTVTSTGTPAVDGTYACDDAQQDIVTRIQAYITKNNAFPGGLSAVQLRKADGSGYIAIGTVALFQAVGSAIADFVAKADEAELAVLAGGSWVAPSNAVTIA
jgi:hypothetical protein